MDVRFFGSNKPPRLLNTVAGFGVTPRVGLRFGAAVAQGAYASVEEFTNRPPGDRDATMVQVEGEWSFGYTRIVGEWVKSVIETARADSKTQGYWMEATQTLSPRLFAAGRFDSQRYDYQRPNLRLEHQTYSGLKACSASASHRRSRSAAATFCATATSSRTGTIR